MPRLTRLDACLPLAGPRCSAPCHDSGNRTQDRIAARVAEVLNMDQDEIGNEYCWSGVCRGKGRAHSKKKEFHADKMSC